MSERVIISAQEIQRLLSRMAHEILERNRDAEQLVLVGVRTRGVPLAHRLAARLHRYGNVRVQAGTLDIGLYRDDLGERPVYRPRPTDALLNVEGQAVVIVDDVLYTGRSARAAMDALMDLGRPSAVQLAVLVDRGHRELPIKADYVGKNIPTARHEEVRVHLEETDGRDEVVLVHLPGGPREPGQSKRLLAGQGSRPG